jgi:hypothetical protein
MHCTEHERVRAQDAAVPHVSQIVIEGLDLLVLCFEIAIIPAEHSVANVTA